MIKKMIQKLKLFDIAANLTDDQFQGVYHHKHHHKPDVMQVIQRAEDVGCSHLLIASGHLADIEKALELCKLSPNFYTTAGIHPCRAAEPAKNPKQYLARVHEWMGKAH